MGNKTASALAMDEVARRVAPVLKQAGFKKRRRAFNRATEPGVVQVISFQMSYAHSGRFTLNLGVYAEQLHTRYVASLPVGNWVNEYNCQLRKRIGQLLPGGRDTWWQTDDIESATRTVQAALVDYALPWLDQQRAQTAVFVDTYSAAQEYRLQHSPRRSYTRLDATICASDEEAIRLMQQALGVARARAGAELQLEAPVPDVGDAAVLIRGQTVDASGSAWALRTLVARQNRFVLRLRSQQPANAPWTVSLEPVARRELTEIQRRYVARGRRYPTPISFADND